LLLAALTLPTAGLMLPLAGALECPPQLRRPAAPKMQLRRQWALPVAGQRSGNEVRRRFRHVGAAV